MPKEFVVGDTSYHFPDNYSDQQVQSILAKQGVIKPPEASPMAKAGHAFIEGLGIPAMLDIIGASNRHGTPQEIASRAANQKAALQGIVQGIVGEPGRVWGELSRTGESMLKGDLSGTAYHLAGSVPLLGAPAQQVAQDVQRGDPAAAVGHTAAMVLPFLAGPAARTAGRGIAATEVAMETAAPAARAAVKAGGRDVVVGAGKTAAGAVLAKAGPLGEIGDVIAGVPIVKSGMKQMGRGVRAAYTAGKEAAEAARAAAPVAEAAAQYPEGSMGVLSPEYFQGPTRRSPLFPDLPPPESGPPAAVVALDSSLNQLAQHWAGVDFASLSPQEQAQLHGEVGRMAPAEARADFEQRRATLEQGQPPTPGQQFAKSQGYDWAKLSLEDRQALEQVAQAQANMAAQNLEVPPQPQPPPAPAEPRTLADLMQGGPATELEGQLAESIRKAQAAKPTAAETPPPPAAPPKAENVFVKNARLAKAVRVADAAQEAGLKSGDIFRMSAADFAAKVGEKSISADTMAMVVDKLRKLESQAPPAASASAPAAPKSTPPAPRVRKTRAKKVTLKDLMQPD